MNRKHKKLHKNSSSQDSAADANTAYKIAQDTVLQTNQDSTNTAADANGTAYHVPVLLHESIEALVTNPDGIYADAGAFSLSCAPKRYPGLIRRESVDKPLISIPAIFMIFLSFTSILLSRV